MHKAQGLTLWGEGLGLGGGELEGLDEGLGGGLGLWRGGGDAWLGGGLGV